MVYPPAHPPAPAGPVTSRSTGLLKPHLIWEAVLLALTVVAAVVWSMQDGSRMSPVLFAVASTGLLATAFALSLRTATPNLAVVGVAALAGVTYAGVLDAGAPVLVAAFAAIAAAAFAGVAMGLVAGLLQAPGWAVSLGGLALMQGIVLAATGGTPQRLAREGVIRSEGAATGWLVLFLLLSIGGAVVWSVPAVRQALSGNRVVAGEPPSPFGARLLGAVVGMGVSSLIAGAAGVLLTGRIGGTTLTAADITQLAIVAGAVLLGGVSVAGGRGGYLGTVLGVVLLSLVHMTVLVANGPRWMPTVVFGLAVLAGLGVSRALEALQPARPAGAPSGKY